MSEPTEFKKKLDAKIAELTRTNEENTNLFDRSGDKANMPQPSDSFIKGLGGEKTGKSIEQIKMDAWQAVQNDPAPPAQEKEKPAPVGRISDVAHISAEHGRAAIGTPEQQRDHDVDRIKNHQRRIALLQQRSKELEGIGKELKEMETQGSKKGDLDRVFSRAQEIRQEMAPERERERGED